jgi:hypothetical protein
MSFSSDDFSMTKIEHSRKSYISEKNGRTMIVGKNITMKCLIQTISGEQSNMFPRQLF